MKTMKTIVFIPIEVELQEVCLQGCKRIVFCNSPSNITKQIYRKAIEQIKNSISIESYTTYLNLINERKENDTNISH
jgi:hypothetical protein